MEKLKNTCKRCGYCCSYLAFMYPSTPDAIEFLKARGFEIGESLGNNCVKVFINHPCPHLIKGNKMEMYKYLSRELVKKIPTAEKTIERAIKDHLDGYYDTKCPDKYEYREFCANIRAIAKEHGIQDEESFWKGQELHWKRVKNAPKKIQDIASCGIQENKPKACAEAECPKGKK